MLERAGRSWGGGVVDRNLIMILNGSFALREKGKVVSDLSQDK